MDRAPYITEKITKRAYNRIVVDPCGLHNKSIKLEEYLNDFPVHLQSAIECYGYIDKWASQCSFNAYSCVDKCADSGEKKSVTKRSVHAPSVKIHNFHATVFKKKFWFITIQYSFSDSFWRTWISAIDEMRFCVGLGGKQDAYVRCSCTERDAVFTTARKYVYHTLPMTEMEEKILSLARFVMSYQKAYVEYAVGSEYKVTWDSNLLHHVVGPIANAVYKAHNDYSPLLCSFPSDDKKLQHVHKDVYLPLRDQMQVLTIFCSNYDPDSERCTKIAYKYDDGSLIGTAHIPSREIHIQGPGSQILGINHETTVNSDAKKSGIYRCICTTRLTLTPKHGEAFDDHVQLEHVPTGKNNGGNNQMRSRDIDAHNITSVISLSSSITSCDTRPLHQTRKRNINVTHQCSEEICDIDKGLGQYSAAVSKKSRSKGNLNGAKQKGKVNKVSLKPARKEINLVDVYSNIPKQKWSEYNIPAVTIRIHFKDRVHQLSTGPALLCLL
jgi:hypothetical protein